MERFIARVLCSSIATLLSGCFITDSRSAKELTSPIAVGGYSSFSPEDGAKEMTGIQLAYSEQSRVGSSMDRFQISIAGGDNTLMIDDVEFHHRHARAAVYPWGTQLLQGYDFSGGFLSYPPPFFLWIPSTYTLMGPTCHYRTIVNAADDLEQASPQESLGLGIAALAGMEWRYKSLSLNLEGELGVMHLSDDSGTATSLSEQRVAVSLGFFQDLD